MDRPLGAEDEVFWEQTGKAIARRNLAFSIFAEHLGFSIWVLWTIIVLNLANIGITLSVSELFVLVAVPNLIGSFLRVRGCGTRPRPHSSRRWRGARRQAAR